MPLIVVTDRSQIADAVDRLRNQLKEGSQSITRTLGYPSGREKSVELIWRSADRLWAHINSNYLATRHWCAYGTAVGARNEVLNIALEINPPKEGVDRRVRGQILSDDAGECYLGHKGGLGGGRRGVVPIKAFWHVLQHPCKRQVLWEEDDKTACMHIIGRIGDPTIISGLSHLVAEAERIRGLARDGTLPLSK